MAASVTIAKKVRVVAIHDFDPRQADAILTQDCLKNPPNIQAQLPLSRGQCLEILTKNVKSWWLYVRCVFSEKEGFIPSICVVPLREDVDDEKLVQCTKFDGIVFTLDNFTSLCLPNPIS